MQRYLGTNTPSQNENQYKQQSPDQRAKPSKKTNLNTIILKKQSEHESLFNDQDLSENSKDSPSKSLCELFLLRIASRKPGNFQIKELLDGSGIQRRRVYDLMNILEGCGYIKKISKATYNWKGFNPVLTGQTFKKEEKETLSLSELASHIHHQLFFHDDKIELEKVAKQIQEQYSKRNITQKSLKRRVYECFKVMKGLGLIKKEDRFYRWVREGPDVASIIKEKKLSSIKTKANTSSSKKNAIEQPKEEMKTLIQSVLDKIGKEEELNSFINHLKDAFFTRLQSVSKQLKYE